MKEISSKVAKKLEKFFDAAQQEVEKRLPDASKGLSKPKRTLLVSIVISMLLTKSVVYDELAEQMNDEVELASNVRRLQRFIAEYDLNYDQIAILTSFLLPKGKWELSMDRTNWKYGSASLNILAVTVWVKGVGVPIWFELLDNKGGNSNQAKRIDFLEKLISLFGVKKIKCLYGDREFIGEKWIGYLKKNNIPFCLRIKSDTIIRFAGQSRGRAAHKWLYKKRVRYMPHVEVYGVKGLHLIAKGLSTLKKNGQPEELLLLTNIKANKTVMDSYKRRWSIEVFFQCIKSRGFNLEKTHLTDPERFRKIFAAVCLAFVCCFCTGVYKDAKIKKISLCKHGYKRKSFFRYGLDELRRLLRLASRGKEQPLEEFLDLLCARVIRLPDQQEQPAILAQAG